MGLQQDSPGNTFSVQLFSGVLLTTIHSVGLIEGVSSLGVERGLERGVAKVDAILGVRDLK